MQTLKLPELVADFTQNNSNNIITNTHDYYTRTYSTYFETGA